ncbi:hypothetical protein [Blastococcus mobilis]|uniref:Thioesterase superfamily protein n=1 Tax=Blastococcus mobilis TaxID=1938746 RepID=A0A238XXU4_9ACTN|nr:hypothetical protein [Blastococcus mobilis]SNR63510.1 hypothetical protein SAMN06272737_11680 [Blastococcus mobilis]
MGRPAIEDRHLARPDDHAASGPLTAIGRVIKPGRRVAFADGEVLDAAGRSVATASSSLLVFPLPAA